jgi:hypothetical protein
MEAVDTVRGIYHFLGDMAPRNVPKVEPKPRKVNVYQHGGQDTVSQDIIVTRSVLKRMLAEHREGRIS